eukprot:scaffold1004_cov269-Pinguiococcus_pyrenoidosus.AAC.2
MDRVRGVRTLNGLRAGALRGVDHARRCGSGLEDETWKKMEDTSSCDAGAIGTRSQIRNDGLGHWEDEEGGRREEGGKGREEEEAEDDEERNNCQPTRNGRR